MPLSPVPRKADPSESCPAFRALGAALVDLGIYQQGFFRVDQLIFRVL